MFYEDVMTVMTSGAKKSLCRCAFVGLLLCLLPSPLSSQTIIRGFVRDSVAGNVLPLASIRFEGQASSVKTNIYGFFEIEDTTASPAIIVTLNKYKEKRIPVDINQINALDILLQYQNNQLVDLINKAAENDYSVNNNPAVALIEQVIGNKNNKRIETQKAYTFNRYEKLNISVDDILNTLKSNKLLQKLHLAYNDLEISDFSNQPILTISSKELISEEFRKKKPETKKYVVIAERHEGVDNASITKSIASVWEETFNDIDIFEDNIQFLFKEFISPLSSTAAIRHYKYFMGDTVIFKNTPCVQVGFTPSDPKDNGFTGQFWISLDGDYVIRKVILNIPEGNNINFVKQLLITQEFDSIADGLWAKSHSSTTVKFDGFRLIYDMYFKREITYSDYKTDNINTAAFQFPEETIILKDAENQSDSFWITNRPFPLKTKTKETRELENEFSHSPLFRTSIFLLKVVTTGYVGTNGDKNKNKVDIGPVGTFFSVNDIEGIRLKLGGQTTSNLSRYFYLKGYGAYGIKDDHFKYSGTATWSINGKNPEYDYGLHTLSFRYQYDVDIPGEHFFYTNPDNILLSFKRGKDDLMTYLRKGLLTYTKEFNNGLGIQAWTHFQNEKATGSLQFLQEDADGNITDLQSYNSSEIGIRLRYAHNNIFYKRRNAQLPINRNVPVFFLTYTQGINGYLNGDYNYKFAEVSINKLFWMSTAGYIDTWVKAGQMWGTLPFPLLILPNANRTYSIQPEAYSMVYPLEFINDRFASLDMTVHFNSILFRHIPFLKRFNFREVVSFKGLYGDLSDKNLPENNQNLFLFPEHSRTMTKDPYMEASIGIENIFKVLRVDYVRRLSYLNDPGISKGGIRFALRFSF